ncbi:MAG: caspase family protein [Asgard group archaeon]|nr:caspase family protein [Asgard group archaeon]
MRKRYEFSKIIALVILSSLLFSPLLNNVKDTKGETTKDVKTFGLLVDQFAPSTRLENNYGCNANEFKNSLISIGWSTDSFSYLFGDGTITIANLQEEMDYLEEVVDANDVVVIFFATHGYGCLKDILHFNEWFHKEFLEIPTDYKFLLIDACHAGEFIEPLQPYTNNNSFYAMGSVSAIEYGIGFIPDSEGWPYSEPEFYGIISAHFWSTTLINSSADSDLDNYISMNEMYDYSLPIIRKIYSEVFVEDPELAEFIENETGSLENYPHPLVINTFTTDYALAMDFLTDNIDSLPGLSQGQLFGIFIPLGAVILTTLIIIPIVLRRKN